jgi:hypothetical protein
MANPKHLAMLKAGVQSWNARPVRDAIPDLGETKLCGADLERSTLVDTDLRGADLTGCRVYGISAWDVQLDEHTRQTNPIITPYDEPEVRVDNLKVAQFVYLLLSNTEIREIIDTLTTRRSGSLAASQLNGRWSWMPSETSCVTGVTCPLFSTSTGPPAATSRKPSQPSPAWPGS